MSTDDRADRAASFDRAAAVYQATRPATPTTPSDGRCRRTRVTSSTWPQERAS